MYLNMYYLFHYPNMNIYQAECEAETEIIDPKSKTKSSSLSDLDDLSMDDDGSSSSKEKDGKSTVEIRADHVAKIAAELMLDLS